MSVASRRLFLLINKIVLYFRKKLKSLIMKVEIWSDIVCPFCYIGKRKFENALNAFDKKEQVEIVWHSFQLDPDMIPVKGQSVDQYLATRKGVSLEKGKEMNDYMSGIAKEVGLEYNFDKAIVNNTMNALSPASFGKKRGRSK